MKVSPKEQHAVQGPRNAVSGDQPGFQSGYLLGWVPWVVGVWKMQHLAKAILKAACLTNTGRTLLRIVMAGN